MHFHYTVLKKNDHEPSLTVEYKAVDDRLTPRLMKVFYTPSVMNALTSEEASALLDNMIIQHAPVMEWQRELDMGINSLNIETLVPIKEPVEVTGALYDAAFMTTQT